MGAAALGNPQLEKLAEIYSLILSIDHVERAYVRDTIAAADYNEVMARLLSQYAKVVKDPDVAESFNDIETFARKFNIDSPAGIERIKVGILATAEAIDLPSRETGGPDKSASSSRVSGLGGRSGKAIAEVSGNFITFSDGIHLGFRGKEDLHPLLAELATSLNRVTKENFDGRGKLVEWLIKLNQLKGSETLTDAEAQRCLEEVEHGYHSFLALLD